MARVFSLSRGAGEGGGEGVCVGVGVDKAVGSFAHRLPRLLRRPSATRLPPCKPLKWPAPASCAR
jgi:hypothetical protein